MKDPHGIYQPTVAVSYLQLMVEIVTERGLAVEQLLAGVPIDRALLNQPDARMSPYQWTLVVQNATRLTRDPGLGYENGLRMRASSHGFLGYAMLSCASMRQAMELSQRYFQARQRNFTMSLDTEGEYCNIEVREKHPIPEVRRFHYENILIGMARGSAAIIGMELTQLPDAEIWFDWPEPPYHAAYRERLPMVRFSRPANLLRFPARLLELRPVLADPFASRQAIELCERELAQVGGLQDPIGLRVCAELVLSAQGGYPNLDTVAKRLHMSSRSLARKLQANGSSFQLLLENARRRDAHALIESGNLELQAVSARLGYLNPANFTRAFRKWTGQSPSQYRERLRREPKPHQA